MKKEINEAIKQLISQSVFCSQT